MWKLAWLAVASAQETDTGTWDPAPIEGDEASLFERGGGGWKRCRWVRRGSTTS